MSVPYSEKKWIRRDGTEVDVMPAELKSSEWSHLTEGTDENLFGAFDGS